MLQAVIWDPTDTREYKCHYQKLLFFFNTCDELMILLLVCLFVKIYVDAFELSFDVRPTMKFQQVYQMNADFSRNF